MKRDQRKDLDSLRGIAILSVVLFHLNKNLPSEKKYFSNGHFGVDIFFVLSGYFIFTSHCLMPDRPLFEFFSKRIWRIFPGYFFFLTVTIIFAYLLLIPSDFVYFIEELQKASCFVSNLKFNTKKGYFDTVADHYFLLHTWSVSIEIQFYTCSAFIALFLKKIGAEFVVVLIIASIGSHYFVSTNVAFYSLPCRIWQFLFGFLAIKLQSKFFPLTVHSNESLSDAADLEPLIQGEEADLKKCSELREEEDQEKEEAEEAEMVQLISNKRVDFLKTICVFLIIFLCLISGYHKFLFPQRILVNLLACYVVTSSSNEFSKIDLLWNNQFLQFFGQVSYSWYLWHWPVSVLFTYWEANILVPINLSTYIIAPFILATLTTYLLERPLQKIGFGKIVTSLVAIIPSLLFYTIATVVFLQTRSKVTDETHNLQLTSNATRFDPKEPAADKVYLQLRPCYDQSLQEHCVLGDANAADHTVIFGDSHAMSVFIAHSFLPAVIDNSTKVSFIGKPGCQQYGTYSTCKYAIDFLGCFKFTKAAFKKLRTMRMDRVMLVARFIQTYEQIIASGEIRAKAKLLIEQCIANIVKEIARLVNVKEIVLLHQIPHPGRGDVPLTIERALKTGSNLTNLNKKRTKHDSDFGALHEAMQNVKINCPKCSSLLDPASLLCDKDTCPIYTVTDGNVVHSLYEDDQHLNDYGARKLSPLFERPNGAWWARALAKI